jgi:hypothetical protein
MLNLGTLKDANTIARSPFLQPDEVRFRTSPPSVWEAFSAWRMCKKRSTHANMATFNDIKPQDCMDVLVMNLRASFFQHPESMRLILQDRRAEYDPTVLPWKSKNSYLEQLAKEKRLPADQQEKMERLITIKDQKGIQK